MHFLCCKKFSSVCTFGVISSDFLVSVSSLSEGKIRSVEVFVCRPHTCISERRSISSRVNMRSSHLVCACAATHVWKTLKASVCVCVYCLQGIMCVCWGNAGVHVSKRASDGQKAFICRDGKC